MNPAAESESSAGSSPLVAHQREIGGGVAGGKVGEVGARSIGIQQGGEHHDAEGDAQPSCTPCLHAAVGGSLQWEGDDEPEQCGAEQNRSEQETGVQVGPQCAEQARQRDPDE
jgi:hypothetical protein